MFADVASGEIKIDECMAFICGWNKIPIGAPWQWKARGEFWIGHRDGNLVLAWNKILFHPIEGVLLEENSGSERHINISSSFNGHVL